MSPDNTHGGVGDRGVPMRYVEGAKPSPCCQGSFSDHLCKSVDDGRRTATARATMLK